MVKPLGLAVNVEWFETIWVGGFDWSTAGACNAMECAEDAEYHGMVEE